MTASYELLRKLILPLDEIDKATPKKGKIIDFGCGQGLIANFLAKKSSRQVIGIDANIKRLPKSSKKNLTFKKNDITTMSIEKINGAILSDVLHHLTLKEQHKLLGKIYKSLNKKGVLIIKEIDTSEFIRSHLSRLWDFIIYPKDKIIFTNHKYLSNTLTKLGFKVITTRPCRYFPGSTTLYVCIKK